MPRAESSRRSAHESRVSVTIMGIDPGLTATGYGVITVEGDQLEAVDWGVIHPDGDGLPDRLRCIYGRLIELLKRHRPAMVAVEDIFLGRNPRSALLIGHARGVVLLAAAACGIPVREFPAAVIKRSLVGGGRAAKPQVAYMVGQILSLRAARLPADAADALAAAITCSFRDSTRG